MYVFLFSCFMIYAVETELWKCLVFWIEGKIIVRIVPLNIIKVFFFHDAWFLSITSCYKLLQIDHHYCDSVLYSQVSSRRKQKVPFCSY